MGDGAERSLKRKRTALLVPLEPLSAQESSQRLDHIDPDGTEHLLVYVFVGRFSRVVQFFFPLPFLELLLLPAVCFFFVLN
jgi:hypothetical protein